MKLPSMAHLSDESPVALYAPQRDDIEIIYRAPIPKVKKSVFYPYWCVVVNLIFGLLGMVILLAVLPFLLVIIYLDSPGPIFYTQQRLGHRGAIFRIYKFRSMYVGQHDESFIRTTKLDSRITRVGRFLRATHFDELPQVINILCGHMNVVGPRPEQPEIAAQLEEAFPHYRTRLEIKPGLTGWAQVKYQYTNALQGDAVKLKYDLYYIANKSVQLDAIILLRTLLEVISLRGR